MASIFDHIAGGGDPGTYAEAPSIGLGATPDPDPAPYTGATGSGWLDRAINCLLSQTVDGARSAITLPRDVMHGTVDPMSDAGIARAQGMAGLMVGGGMPMAEEGALGAVGGRSVSFVDPAAPTWSLYHGTNAPADFARFDPAAAVANPQSSSGMSREGGAPFFTPSPAEANHYAQMTAADDAPMVPGQAGSRIIPVKMDPGKTALFDLPHMFEGDDRFADILADHNGYNDGLDEVYRDRVSRTLDSLDAQRQANVDRVSLGQPEAPLTFPTMMQGAGAAIQLGRERGLDSIVIRGLRESSGGDQIVALTPGRVHSAIDGRLLYSGGPGNALLQGALGGAAPRNALTGARMPAPTPAQFNALLAAGGAT